MSNVIDLAVERAKRFGFNFSVSFIQDVFMVNSDSFDADDIPSNIIRAIVNDMRSAADALEADLDTGVESIS